MRIAVNNYYMHENNLVRVIGAKGMESVETLEFMIEWRNDQDERCTAHVKGRELGQAPSIERLYQDYQQALEVICKQANIIEELEAKINERGMYD
jgi:predicted dehydrogenase